MDEVERLLEAMRQSDDDTIIGPLSDAVEESGDTARAEAIRQLPAWRERFQGALHWHGEEEIEPGAYFWICDGNAIEFMGTEVGLNLPTPYGDEDDYSLQELLMAGFAPVFEWLGRRLGLLVVEVGYGGSGPTQFERYYLEDGPLNFDAGRTISGIRLAASDDAFRDPDPE